MKKHPVLFKICLILLLFGIASVQALKDSEHCGSENSENPLCDENNLLNNDHKYEDPEVKKSVFSESHDCELTGEGEEGSCLRKESIEEGVTSNIDEDASELSMSEQVEKEEHLESCELSDDKTSTCAGKHSEDNVHEPNDKEKDESNEKENDNADEKENDEPSDNVETVQESPEKTVEGNTVETVHYPDVQMESPEEAEKNEQDSDLGGVPLREILLKLKPEGLTDNEDDQPNVFSVTEASLGEEEEVEEETLVSSGSAEKQEPGSDASNSDGSKNGSGSSSGMNKKAICAEVNVTDEVVDVEIINATLLMKLLQGNPNVTNRSSAAPCHLVYFFSPYCPFSVAGSHYINAMARSLKNIPVYGLDSIEYHSVNARYGVMGTPTLLLFHNGNGVGRYNASQFSVMQLLSFINHYTDQVITDINVTSLDFRASLPTQLAEGRPYALWASWVFLLSCASWLFITSEVCARLTEAVLNNWREAEAQNDQD